MKNITTLPNYVLASKKWILATETQQIAWILAIAYLQSRKIPVEEVTKAHIEEATELPLDALLACGLFELRTDKSPVVFGYNTTTLSNRRTGAAIARSRKSPLIGVGNQRASMALIDVDHQPQSTPINEAQAVLSPENIYFTEGNPLSEAPDTSKTPSKNELISILRTIEEETKTERPIKTKRHRYNSIYLFAKQGPWLIPERLIKDLVAQHGLENFAGLLARASAWLVANPSKLKPPVYMEEFLVRWCARTKIQEEQPFQKIDVPKKKKRNFRDEAWDAMYN